MNWTARTSLFVYEIRGIPAPELFAPHANDPYSLWFDSNRDAHPDNRYSYLCFHPFEKIESRGDRVRVINRENEVTYRADPFTVVRERLALWGGARMNDKNLPPFQGGAAGFFGYDLMRGLEKIPANAAQDYNIPDMCIGLYDKVIAYNHLNKSAIAMIQAKDKSDADAQYQEIITAAKAGVSISFHAKVSWENTKSDGAFRKDIERVIDYIHAGDIFQANLSRRFSAIKPHDYNPYAHYLHLRDINAAPFSAFMNFENLQILCTSPERFLQIQDGRISTKPIKGTMPSHLDPTLLRESEKDRAENIMIVDLLRNDLSKVCEDHSISVDALCAVETFEGLHHLVSTISGNLRADCHALDALRACFPGGSITGAPKIRAMEIIEELEPQRRGPYCGAMGWMGWNGDMDTNIVIRTMISHGDKIHLQTGGGITAQSQSSMELEETLVKAKKLFESFESHPNEERKNS